MYKLLEVIEDFIRAEKKIYDFQPTLIHKFTRSIQLHDNQNLYTLSLNLCNSN